MDIEVKFSTVNQTDLISMAKADRINWFCSQTAWLRNRVGNVSLKAKISGWKQ